MNVTETLNYYCTYIYARIYFYVKQICLLNGDFSILESRQIYQQNKDIFLTFNFAPGGWGGGPHQRTRGGWGGVAAAPPGGGGQQQRTLAGRGGVAAEDTPHTHASTALTSAALWLPAWPVG